MNDIDKLLAAGNSAKLKTNTATTDWNGKIQIHNLDRVDPGIKAFIESKGSTLASYAKQALIEQLKKDGFEL